MSLKILVVDDEKDLRDLLKYFLTREKYDVETAENGQEAFERIKDWEPDLVISDIRMPVCDGFELINHLSKLDSPKPSVMFISGYAGGDEDKLKKNPLCVGFVMKPVNKNELLSMVANFSQNKPLN